jgi:hypothetical protein
MLDQHHHPDEGLRVLIRKAVDDLLSRTPADEPIFQIDSGAKTFLSLQDGRIRFIQDLQGTREDRDGHTCITCGEPLTPRLGEINAKHFAHRAGSECAGGYGAAETVLHHMGKRFAAALGKVLLSGPITEQSAEFTDIIEEAFSGGILTYHRGALEQRHPESRFRYLPDVLAQLDGSFEGRPLLIEIHVTNPVSEEKRAQVGPDGDDVDMLEIHLDDLYRKALEEKLPVTKRLVAGAVRSDAPREWVHSRVQRILRNRVRRREVERRIQIAETGFRALSDQVRALRGREKLRPWRDAEPLLPDLTRWAEAEAADLRDLSARLDRTLRDAPKPVSLDRPVRSVSDLSGDLLHQEIGRLLPLFSDLRGAETELDGALSRLSDLIDSAKRALSESDEADDRSVDLAIEAQSCLVGDLYRSEGRLRAIDGSVEALEQGEPHLKRGLAAAEGGARLFMSSVLEKVEAVERIAGGDAKARRELLERQARRQGVQEGWDRLLGEGASLILGSSWVRYDPHPELGVGLGYAEANTNLRMLCEKLKSASIPSEFLHDVLQTPVPFLQGAPLHEALRYDRSRDILDRLVGLISDADLGAAK